MIKTHLIEKLQTSENNLKKKLLIVKAAKVMTAKIVIPARQTLQFIQTNH